MNQNTHEKYCVQGSGRLKRAVRPGRGRDRA